MDFQTALKQEKLDDIRKCPKADLHNHFVLGGSRRFLKEQTGKDIQPITEPLNSMDEMHAWNAQNIGEYFNSSEGRRMLIQATFVQAKEDGVSVLEIGEDVWGLGEFFHENIDELVEAFELSHKEIAPEIELRLQIGLSRHCDVAYLEDCLSHFWGCKAFYSIDLYGDDVLIFDSDVSKEYLRLYQSGCLNAEELDNIRKNGLKKGINQLRGSL